MSLSNIFYRILAIFVVLSMLLSSVAPVAKAQTPGQVFLPLVAANAKIPATNLAFRTQVRVSTPARWQELHKLGVVELARGDDWALVLADDPQLADLARLRFNPDHTNALEPLALTNAASDQAAADSLQPLFAQLQVEKHLLAAADANVAGARAQLRTTLANLTAAQQTFLAQAADVDTDHDGLTDTAEGFWCTNAQQADTDHDGMSDGDEVKALKAWMNNETAGPPSTGKPFLGWPPQIPQLSR